MSNIWESFFDGMEKIAINPLSVAAHGMSIMGIKDRIRQSEHLTKLNPINKDRASGLKLKSPYQYQFFLWVGSEAVLIYHPICL